MDLSESLQRASLLMSREGQNLIEGKASGVKHNMDNKGNYTKPINTKNPMSMMPTPQQNIKSSPNSKLPKEIMESLMKNPINESSMLTSSLDNINLDTIIPPKTQVKQPQYQPQQPTYIQETVNYQPQPQVQYIPQPMMNVDYNYIRSIVNECIQNSLQQIKEEILKESTLKTVRLGGENKIQLIDNKNNLYESKLEFKRNLNKK